MPAPFKTRFAPSPTGFLHLGNVRTALFNYLLAQARNGVFLLRIEDTDATRGHEKFTQALKEDLRWLGLPWSEGPDAGGAHAPYAQSERGEIYKKYFDALQAKSLAYPCFCSEHELAIARKTQLAAGKPPRYSGKCRHLTAAEVAERFSKGIPATVRFRVPEGKSVQFDDKVRGPQNFVTDDIGDFIVRRSDGSTAFFFCNAIDDALMGITLVVRGEDHLTNTPRQILLLQALGLPVPDYAHIALVLGSDNAPLSKRTGSKSVQELREAGFLPLAINNYLARVGHGFESNACLSMPELARAFLVEKMHKAPAHYDESQLLHWQKEAVMKSSTAELVTWVKEAIDAFVPAVQQQNFVEAVRGNVLFAKDAAHWARVVYGTDFHLSHDAKEVLKTTGEIFFDATEAALTEHGVDFKAVSARVKQQTGLSGKGLFQPLRAALTGELDGPEMAKLVPLLGAERARERVRRARSISR
jgi:glutamyl-tRNA synthetase